ncbi:tellurite resistance protein [Thioflavicoccus mobilis 8321]|uniref:Tellurite resistance protein n=1 Tax=Thioflavicoccus mobilis 8321 TaxID=765912 RepID=L0H2Q5_9GAMM|nr:tellurite resistance TerB family protein [Thioflavicoccus mobilis]AGA92347.1 tellurite resistance protein [Thioflavicoccus mobilis 8321]
MLASFKQKFDQMSKGLKEEVSRLRNRDFLEGCVAGCALVANADGVVDPEEKRKMLGFMQTSDALSLYDTNDVIALFNKYNGNFEFDFGIGQAQALKTIAPLAKKPADARLLVRVCCVIGAADGNFDEHERAAVRRICQELSLDPEEFGV